MSKSLTEILDQDVKPAFAELERRLSALEDVAHTDNYVSPLSDDKPSSNGQLVHEALNHINAPIQSSEIRIRPDDMVMVKWEDEEQPRQMIFRKIGFEFAIGLLEWLSPILPEQSGDERTAGVLYGLRMALDAAKKFPADAVAIIDGLISDFADGKEQSGDGWIKILELPDHDTAVWGCWKSRVDGEMMVRMIDYGNLEPGDLWQPIDPNHPDEPPMKPEGM